MSRWFGRKKERDKKSDGRNISRIGKSFESEPSLAVTHSRQSSSSFEGREENGLTSSPTSTNDGVVASVASLRPRSISPGEYLTTTSPHISPTTSGILDPTQSRDYSRNSVRHKKEMFESLSKPSTPEHSASSHRGSTPGSRRYSGASAGTTPTHNSFSKLQNASQPKTFDTSYDMLALSSLLHSSSLDTDVGKEKEFKGVALPLPPLQTSRVKHRDVTAVKIPSFGFGFNLRKSFQPDPDNPDSTLLVHLVEPRPNYVGPLMSGDRILEVNGENVETAPHERVVELIKQSGDQVDFRVASVPELMELNERGAFEENKNIISQTKKNVKAGAGTLRKIAAKKRPTIDFEARTDAQILSDRNMIQQDQVWLVHKKGFSLAVVHQEESPLKGTQLASHMSILRSHTRKVQLVDNGQIVEIDDTDIEKVNPPDLDRVEDIVDLVHLNESSVLHVLRQRYGSSLIHTFAGKHLIVINPLRHLSLYSDRIVEMFRGCRREDMPPHIFATGQQAYHSMMESGLDQSIILSGVSGSGKTFNTRYLLRYLSTIGQVEGRPVTSGKLDAIELLLHAFTSSSTYLNPQATRCSCLYSLEFDSGGFLSAASVRTFLLEKSRVASCPVGELNFNIFYHLLAGVATDESLQKELLMNVPPGTDEPNHYIEPYTDPQLAESAVIVWDLIQNCLSLLGISDDEALGLWSLLGAIYHLGHAGVKHGIGASRVNERFINPAAAMRAASLLGLPFDELAKDIFNPPRGTISSRLSSSVLTSSLSTSPSISETSSINLSINSFTMSPNAAGSNRSLSLDAFVIGLYEQALNSLILLINRALQPSGLTKGLHLIHVLDTPGFQHRDMAGCKDGSSFDDLCVNYTRERLQMLFHDHSFTSEQDRYIQENIDWTFSEMVLSPLSVIDIIDKHVPQRRGPAFQGLEFNDKRGLLWILEEESTSGGNEITFLEKLHSVHGEPDDFGEVMLKTTMDKGQFTILHCQRSLPITYDVTGWCTRVREHPSTRVVAQILTESKNKGVASLYQGRGVSASMSATSSKLELQGLSRLSRHPSFSNPTVGIKKSSQCLKTKFQLDFLVDLLRKTNQWYVICVLCQLPAYLPGALTPPNDVGIDEDELPLQGHIDVVLVRDQLRQSDVIPAARIYKQGFPVHQPLATFKRRFSVLLDPNEKAALPENDKDAAEFILSGLELDRNSYRIGLSQVFFRAGILSGLDRQVERKIHDIMVRLQANIRGWLGRQKMEDLELQHAAAHVIQRNIRQHDIINKWIWWKLFQKVKPLLAVWKVEEVVKKKESEIETLTGKVKTIEEERDVLKDNEQRLIDKVTQLTDQLMEAQEMAQHASELLEQEQMDRRELQEQNQDVTSTEHELVKRNEELQLQVAELSILARIKQSEEGEESTSNNEAVLEKYWETKRELETLRQKISTEHEDEIERLQHSKKVLEKKLADSEAETDDLRRNLAMTRKKASKFSSELNDLKLLLETQQARNEELEKRQRKFDADLNIVREDLSTEKQTREKVERERNLLNVEMTSVEQKFKKLQEDYQTLENEKTEIETELLKKGSSDTDSEIVGLKRMKRELESKVEELEDEIDDLNIKTDSLQQAKSRLELAQQSLRSQHQKELEGREDDMEQLKNTMNKKLKSMEQQLEEEHENKQQAIKAKRDLERQLTEFQSKVTGDPEAEKKLRKQVKKYKALLQDAQEELEHERESRSNAAAMRGLRSQLEDLEMREVAAVKGQKRLQGELDELQAQFDETNRGKIELEVHVNELQKVKEDLETRLEEEQDEVEKMTGKLRQSISQVGSVQQQLNEANYQIEELQETKQVLEKKVIQLERKMTELESDSNRQEIEASEVRIREMEQKLELEKSTNKRQEGVIARLRSQLERIQSEKAEDSNVKSSDAIKRLQKQLRDMREELQEAEKKEQDQNKKRRLMETQMSEMEASLQTAQSDLKSAHKRIEGLQQALEEGQGDEDSSGDEDGTGQASPKRPKRRSRGRITAGQEDKTSDDDEEDDFTARLTSRRKQREIQRTIIDEGDDDDDDDVDDFITKLKQKRKVVVDDISDEDTYKRKSSQDEEKERKRYGSSDEDIGHRNHGDDDSPPPRQKSNWRDLLSSGDEDKEPPHPLPSTRRTIQLSDDSNDEQIDSKISSTTRHKKYDLDLSDNGEDTKPNWRKKYNISSSDEDTIVKKTTSLKKPPIAISSDDDIPPITRRKLPSLNDSDDDLPTASRKTKAISSDDDEDKKLTKTSSKTTMDGDDTMKDKPMEKSPSKRNVTWNNEEETPASVGDSVSKSFKSSRERRARRRSRLSNTGTSPEDSPKRKPDS